MLQLVLFTDPSCTGDITAPVLAGETRGPAWWFLNALTAIWKVPVKLLMFSNASKPVEEKVGPYGVVNKAGVAVLGELLVLILPSGPRTEFYCCFWFWQWNVSGLRTVYPKNWCLLMQWAGLQEGWLAAIERPLVRLWLRVVFRDQALSNFVQVSSFNSPFCVIGLWPYLEWAQIRRIRTERGMCAPDQQLVMFLNANETTVTHVHTQTHLIFSHSNRVTWENSNKWLYTCREHNR